MKILKYFSKILQISINLVMSEKIEKKLKTMKQTANQSACNMVIKKTNNDIK
jgi:hypothetical protein